MQGLRRAVLLLQLIQNASQRILVRLVRRLDIHGRDQLLFVGLAARFGDLGLVAGTLVAVVRRVGIRGILHHLAAGFGFDLDGGFVFAYLALFVQNPRHRLIARTFRDDLVLGETIHNKQ